MYREKNQFSNKITINNGIYTKYKIFIDLSRNSIGRII